jgi:hypothetical protein
LVVCIDSSPPTPHNKYGYRKPFLFLKVYLESLIKSVIPIAFEQWLNLLQTNLKSKSFQLKPSNFLSSRNTGLVMLILQDEFYGHTK